MMSGSLWTTVLSSEVVIKRLHHAGAFSGRGRLQLCSVEELPNYQEILLRGIIHLGKEENLRPYVPVIIGSFLGRREAQRKVCGSTWLGFLTLDRKWEDRVINGQDGLPNVVPWVADETTTVDSFNSSLLHREKWMTWVLSTRDLSEVTKTR